MKRLLCLLLALSVLFSLSACSKEKKTVTCDGCGKQIDLEADSNITDDWIVFCEDCGEPVIE